MKHIHVLSAVPFLTLSLAAQQDHLAKPHTLPFKAVLPGTITDYEVTCSESPARKEYILQTRRLTTAGLKLQCTKGRSCADFKPWVVIRHHQTQKGLAIFLAWPGNWRINVQPTKDGNTRVHAITLPDNLPLIATINELPVPGALVSKFTGTLDNATRPITRFIRNKLLRKLDENWPWVEYNTWCDRFDHLNPDRIIKTAHLAAELGCELYTIDAGWYGGDMKGNWKQTLGDWRLNQRKFPNGIKPVSDEIRKLGMKFGMWIEIECASNNSPVIKQHPDWHFSTKGRKVSWRGVIDLGNPDVLSWAKSQIDHMITTYQLDFLKIDFNSDIVVIPGPDTKGRDPLWAYYQGLIDLLIHIRTTYPNLIVENCAGGSRRQDVAMAAMTDLHWISDSVKARDNLAMNYAVTYFFPPEMSKHWTCNAPGTPDYPKPIPAMDLQTQFTVNMLGMFGISAPIDAWHDELLFHAADRTALYKQIRAWLRKSEVYHLTKPVNNQNPQSIEAAQYLDSSGQRSLLFVFQGNDPKMETTFKLHGLDPHRVYRVTMPPAFGHDYNCLGHEFTKGIKVTFPTRGSSAIIRIEAKPPAEAQEKELRLSPITNFKVEQAPIAKANNPTSLKLSWDAVPKATRYLVYVSEKDEPIRPTDECFVNYYITRGLKPETEYNVRVHAEDPHGIRSEPTEILTSKSRSIAVTSGNLWREPWIHAKAESGVPQRNQTIFGDPLRFNDENPVTYDHGIGTHSYSKITFDISRLPADKRTRFTALAGLDVTATEVKPGDSTCVFVVTVDDKEIFRSQKLIESSDPIKIDIPLPANTKHLALIVEPAGTNYQDIADWIEPRVR
ncbi:MAG: alpha-galactosidase [Planctomycetota bacterium]|nr:MAG: alpha-galactosidase [Planctomycetota bacterium]